MTKLFYIAATDDNGDSLDLFVEATDALSAINLWHEWLDENGLGGYGDEEPPETGTPQRRVFEVPTLTGTPHFFNYGAEAPGADAIFEHEV